MSSYPDSQATRPLRKTEPLSPQPDSNHMTVSGGQMVPRAVVTNPLPQGVITRQLSSPLITKKLSAYGPPAEGKILTVIPATEKRRPLESLPRRNTRVSLLGTVILGLLAVMMTILFVSPAGDHGNNYFAQTLSTIFSTNGAKAINLTGHTATPTATPALLTNNGYCGGSDIWGTCAPAVNSSGVMGTEEMASPLPGSVITQAFGVSEYQAWCGCWKPHSGIDLSTAYGSPVLAADSGEVIWVGWDWSGLGWAVKISHGRYIATVYGHLARYIVSVGQTVDKGQVIAYEGSTGASTGPHVHFMLFINNIWVDPAQHMKLP